MKASELRKARREGWTDYSAAIAGDDGNFRQSVRFDMTARGYLGVSQQGGEGALQRVLLTPAQVDALFRFIKQIRKKYSLGGR